MSYKYIVIINTQNNKNKIKYFLINNINKPVIKYTIFNDIEKNNKIDKFVLNKYGNKTFWKLLDSNLKKKNLIFEINKLFNINHNKYYKNIALIIIKKKRDITIISNKIIKTRDINKFKYSKPLNIKFNKLHNLLIKHINNNKKNCAIITGGGKGENDKCKETKKTLNSSAPPFNTYLSPVALSTRSAKAHINKDVLHESPPAARNKSPTSPNEVPKEKEIKDIIGQEHSGKKENMTYEQYFFQGEYIEFKKYNEINIEIPSLTNITKKRKGNTIQNVEKLSNINGMTHIGASLYKGSNPPKIGTIIAGNSGRPGGACGNFDGTLDKIHPNHRTQEEDIISNWFMTYMYNKNITEEEAKIYYGNKLFEYTIFNRWGLLFPYAKRTDIKNYYKTIQGINYRNAKPNDYATAWTIDNVYLSDKFYKYKASRYIHENQYKTTLVFVAGPNNNNPGTNGEFNSVFRTYNKETDKHFHLFMNGVEAALFAGLIAMVCSKCNVALLVNVSGGLYRGEHDKEDYKHAYLNSLDNLLMNVQINGVELGRYFDAVYLL